MMAQMLKAVARPHFRVALETLFEIVIIVIFLKAYNMARNLFGSQACSPEFALGHAEQIIFLERLLGMYWEQEIQAMALPYHLWIKFWNIFYGAAHMAVTVFVLVFLFILKPQAYQRSRTVFFLMNTFALITYIVYPLMPPRLVNDCEDKYGGCVKAYAFVDTLEDYGGLWSWKHKTIAKVSNHYAAMPSMHAGYSIWCSLAMYQYSPYSLFRALAVIYPFLTMYCIVVTANHFILDAVFGYMCYYAALKLADYVPRIGRGASIDSGVVSTLQPSIDIEASDQALLPAALAELQKRSGWQH